MSGRHGALTLSWPAASGECATAEVVLRRDRRRVLVWVHEGPAAGGREGAESGGREGAEESEREAARILPVRVEHGEASLRIRLRERGAGPASGGRWYVPVDGRTGRRIPEPPRVRPA